MYSRAVHTFYYTLPTYVKILAVFVSSFVEICLRVAAKPRKVGIEKDLVHEKNRTKPDVTGSNFKLHVFERLLLRKRLGVGE